MYFLAGCEYFDKKLRTSPGYNLRPVYVWPAFRSWIILPANLMIQPQEIKTKWSHLQATHITLSASLASLQCITLTLIFAALDDFVNRDVEALRGKQLVCLTDEKYCEADGKLEQEIYRNLHSAGLHRRQIYAYIYLLRSCWQGACDLLQTVVQGEELLNLQKPQWKSEFAQTEEKKSPVSVDAATLRSHTWKSLFPQDYSINESKHSSMFARHGRRFNNWTGTFGSLDNAVQQRSQQRVKRGANDCQTGAVLSLIFSLDGDSCRRRPRKQTGNVSDM